MVKKEGGLVIGNPFEFNVSKVAKPFDAIHCNNGFGTRCFCTEPMNACPWIDSEENECVLFPEEAFCSLLKDATGYIRNEACLNAANIHHSE